jgi:uncharacterized membrane protein
MRRFNATLLPHRSLSRKGFLILMAVVTIVSFIAGAVFVWLGAWPVMGFFGLDVLLIYIAFRINYGAADMFERVEVDGAELRIVRVSPSGLRETFRFNPYWARLELEERENAPSVLSLTSHGARLVFGAFLSDAERKEFAAELQGVLAAYR